MPLVNRRVGLIGGGATMAFYEFLMKAVTLNRGYWDVKYCILLKRLLHNYDDREDSGRDCEAIGWPLPPISIKHQAANFDETVDYDCT